MNQGGTKGLVVLDVAWKYRQAHGGYQAQKPGLPFGSFVRRVRIIGKQVDRSRWVDCVLRMMEGGLG